MKKAKIMRLIIVLLLVFALCPVQTFAKKATLKIDSNTVGMTKKEAKAYNAMRALKSKKGYKEGTRWTNSKCYTWHGGGKYTTGCGCVAFAYKLSDTAFGKAKSRAHKNWKKIRVGDVVRMEHDCHSVIIMKVVGTKYVIAEGNFNSKVHWGRVITLKDIKKTGTEVLTRW